MVILSTILRFWQEYKASVSSEALQKMVTNTCTAKRDDGTEHEIGISSLVPGDIVKLAAGDMIPADIRIIETKDLFVSQGTLTGESEAIEKRAEASGGDSRGRSIVELENICFMGSNVVSGSATGIVVSTGNNTYLGTIARSIAGHRASTAFDKGIAKVSMLLIRFMLIMVPFVFLVNGLTKGEWLDAFLFAVSVAVGLTPEMLPMIVTVNLSKGAVAMSRKKTIVKDLNAIQNFGAMNILCTDKTGTLTCDQIVLEKYINADGTSDNSRRILRHAYFNSFFQTGLKNLMDKAILSHVRELEMESVRESYKKVDEIPFDFTRRRMSVVVEDVSGKRQIITKGAVEEMMQICSHTEVGNCVVPFTPELRVKAYEISKRMNRQGLRVLAVAHKSFLSKENNFAVEDESGMVLIGFLAFLDPPKQSAAGAIRQLHAHGIEVKVVSGDNDAVVRTISRQVGIDTTNVLTGAELSAMNDEEKREAVARTRVFAKVTPMQKTEIIALLQTQGNTVGFLGDGINDAAALRQSDIGISVDSAVDIAKESADIILLEKRPHGAGERRDRRAPHLRQHNKVCEDDRRLQLRQHVQRDGRKCLSALPAYAPDTPARAEPSVRHVADGHTVRPHGRRLSQQAAPLGRLRPEPLHDIHGAHKLHIRHHHLSAHVARVRVQLARLTVAVPVGMVCRGTAVADTHRAHDTHQEDSVHTEPRVVAGDVHDAGDNGGRNNNTLHALRLVHRTYAPASVLLSLAGGNAHSLLRADAGSERMVYQAV